MVRNVAWLIVLGLFSVLPPVATTSQAADPVRTDLGRDIPCCMVLALDTSGSMDEDQRLERLKGSTSALVVSLPEGSLAGVVTFNHEARVLVPMTRILDSKRDAFLDPVRNLRAEGGTDILAGLGKGIDLLAPTGGTVVLVSDGLQTGQGDKPLPESVWGKTARDLARRAKERGIAVHTIGLGPDVEADPLLRLLAGEGGGQFFGVRKAEHLVSQFVGLASQIGRYWRRSEAGEFVVTASNEDVIQVVAKGTKPQLLRVSEGKQAPVEPIYRVDRSGVRAERFRLQRGNYRFEPDGAGRSDLLRPMQVSWSFPAAPKLPAGRHTEIPVQAKPVLNGPAELKDLVLSVQLRFGKDGKQEMIKAPVRTSGDGFAVPVLTPARLQPFTATVDAEQRGWHCRVGAISGRVALPSPQEVALLGSQGRPFEKLTDLVTRGSEKEVSLVVEAARAINGPPTDLLVSVTDPRMRVQPDRVRLEKQKQTIRLTLSREVGTAEPPSLAEANLRFTVEAKGDLVEPRLNGGREVNLPFRWRHLRPSLHLHGLPGVNQELLASRGSELLLPVRLEGADLERKSGVQLSKNNSTGFRLEWVDRANGATKALPVLEPNADAAFALRITVSNEVLPGRHFLEFSTQSSEPSVLLNQTREAIPWKIPVVVAPVDVKVHLLEGSGNWLVTAPVETVTRKVQIEVDSVDGGALPPIEIEVLAAGPVRSAERDRKLVSASRLRAQYELSVPPQTAPFEGSVRFRATSPQVRCAQIGIVPVAIQPLVLSASADPVEVPRYSRSLEPLLGWLRGPVRSHLNVRIEGQGVGESHSTWSIVARRPDGAEVITRSRDVQGLELEPGMGYELALTSDYERAVFLPSRRIPIRAVEVVVPLPWWFWALAAAFIALAGLVWFHPWPVRVLVEPDRVHRQFRRISFDQLVPLAGLRLTLSRRFFGGLILGRHRKDNSDVRVIVVLASQGGKALAPGKSLAVHRGETIEIHAPGLPNVQVEVLCGRSARHSVGRGGPGTTKSDPFDFHPGESW